MKRSGTLSILMPVAAGIFSAGLVLGVQQAAASELLFDRGLPTDNLNNAAGSNRSNVAWGDVDPIVSVGDNFTLSNPDRVDTIRVWVVGEQVASNPVTPSANAYELWLGKDTGASSTVTQTAASSAVTQVHYAGGADYQGNSGTFRVIYQVDFGGLNLDLASGTYAFSVSGPVVNDEPFTLTTPFLSASNGPLSGSTQQGDDGLYYEFTAAGAMAPGFPLDSNGNGWDKSSDINVQVYGTVPEPSSIAVLASGLFGLFLLWRREKRA